jgi:DNA-binding MarR family transcriptional regulator
MISDDIQRATALRAPEAGPTASALALLAHEPGLSIRSLAAGVGLSHAGTVRLVDRLVADGLIERRGHRTDGRTRSLFLTSNGKSVSKEVLRERDQIISDGLSVLTSEEIDTLARISERVLQSRLKDREHSFHVCRLCSYADCKQCPVDAELARRALDTAPPSGFPGRA